MRSHRRTMVVPLKLLSIFLFVFAVGKVELMRMAQPGVMSVKRQSSMRLLSPPYIAEPFARNGNWAVQCRMAFSPGEKVCGACVAGQMAKQSSPLPRAVQFCTVE